MTKSTQGSALLPVYSTFPLRAVSGHGSYIVDQDGNEWLDAYGGHAVSSTGHSHPHVVKAIAEQAAKLLFYSTVVPHENRERLADEMAARAPGNLGKVFFCNSGAEANENMLLLARRKTGRSQVVTLNGGWHGRTAATTACTDGAKYEVTARRAGVPLSRKVPLNDIEALDAAVDDTVAAVLLEPVQGFNGARSCTVEFLQAARHICDQRGAKLLFDEVQCGAGRLGTFTAAEYFGVTPDALSLAKGLASGLPIGAVIAAETLVDDIQLGELGSTFGGGPVPCAAALATLEVFDREDLARNVRKVHNHLRLATMGVPQIKQFHGHGALIGLELDRPAAEVQRALWGRRILTGTSTDPMTLRLLPPLTFSLQQVEDLGSALYELLT